jgi:nucleotide-binding universal stress UspA family protein
VYTRILVPLDGSEVAEGALAHAVQMADIFGAELILLRVAFLPSVVQQNVAEAQHIVMSEGEAYLSEIACQLRKPGRRVRTIVHWGKAADSIVACAVQQEVSAVVMATHGHSGLEQWPLGSVAEKVLRSMQVPVLLVRPSQSPASEAGKDG